MSDFEVELKLDFLTESQDLIDSAESAFLRLETERENGALLNEIFRLAHNLKGTSQAVGFDQLAELTHEAENLILKLKDGSLAVTDSIVSTLLEFKDQVQQMIEGLKQDLNAQFDIEQLKSAIAKEVGGNVHEVPDETLQENYHENSQINLAALESLKETGLDDQTIQKMLNDDVDQTIPQSKSENIKSETSQGTVTSKSKSNETLNETDESIRVKLSRIDKINNLIGEIVILQTVVSQRRYEYIQDDLSNKSIGAMNKLFKEVQELATSLRMLPLKQTFQKMTRIVRDTSKLLGKDVSLHLVGEETEVDKTVLEKISDPLVHIVRNAIDHGLETADERVANGKEGKGNVELYAYHEGSNLVIQVTDDGKGIDPEVIRKKASEKGLLSQGVNLSDHEIIQYIFHPGFSTKEEVTEVSGRGVGMDVVKTNIENLGGEVKLMSKLGQGSSFKIILPLTLAIIEGIVIKESGEKYVIPLSQVYEIAQVKVGEIEKFSGIASLFTLRGEVLPLFHIKDKLGKSHLQEVQDYTVILVRSPSHAYGVVVEDIIIQQQIVIKKLGEDIRDKKGFIGSAIMSDGMPSLIIDLFELFKDDIKSSQGYLKLIKRSMSAA